MTRKQPSTTSEKTSSRKPATRKTKKQISAEERRQMIAEAAYFNAERRGFQSGSTEQDWYDAEAEINAMFEN